MAKRLARGGLHEAAVLSERPPAVVAARRPPRRWTLAVLLLAFVLLAAIGSLSSFYTDLLWFREVDKTSVFWGQISAKVTLGLLAGVGSGLIVGINLWLVERLAPRYSVNVAGRPQVERIQQVLGPYLRPLRIGVAAFLGLVVGLQASGSWQTFLLWRNAAPFNEKDPQFHRDIGFYVFQLPFMQAVFGWLFTTLVLALLLSAAGHYLLGGIRPQVSSDRIAGPTQSHLTILLGLIVALKAWGYWLNKYQLVYSTRGAVTGATYTDVKAQIPALEVLFWVALICAVLFFWGVRSRGIAVPLFSIVLLAGISIIIGGITPAVFQRFRVAPQELQRERPFIQRNIDASRRAFGLDRPGRRRQPPHGRQHPALGSRSAQAVHQEPSGDRAVLLVQRRRRGPVPGGRAAPPGDDRGPRGRPDAALQRREDLAEPAPGLHPRLRRGGDPGQHRRQAGPARFHRVRLRSGEGQDPGDPASGVLRRAAAGRPGLRGGGHQAARGGPAHAERRDADVELRRRRGRAALQHGAAAGVRPAVPRHQPADLGQHHLAVAADVQPRHPRAGREGGALPPVGRRSLRGGGRRPHHVRARRLHHHQRLPLRAADQLRGRRAARRDQRRRRPRFGQLHPQLGEGRRRRLHGQGHAVRLRRVRPDPADLSQGVPEAVRTHGEHADGAEGAPALSGGPVRDPDRPLHPVPPEHRRRAVLAQGPVGTARGPLRRDPAAATAAAGSEPGGGDRAAHQCRQDAAVLPADPPAGAERAEVLAGDAVHAQQQTEHARLHGGRLRS